MSQYFSELKSPLYKHPFDLITNLYSSFFSYQPEMQTLVKKIHLSLWKIIRAYTQKTHLLSSTMRLRRFFNWKNSVRFSFFLRKLKHRVKHSFSEQEKRRVTPSIFSMVMVTEPEKWRKQGTAVVQRKHFVPLFTQKTL